MLISNPPKKEFITIKACLKRINQLEAALKAIHTWAAYDIQENRVIALVHGDVIKVCEQALKGDDAGTGVGDADD